MRIAGITLGVLVAAPCGYFVGRWHQAIIHWRGRVRKFRTDRREVLRGPRW